MNDQAPDKKSLIDYSLIALPLAFAGLPLYIHMPDFYAGQFGIGLGALGIMLLFIRFIDAFQDPLIGFISDKFSKNRSAILNCGAACLMIGMAGLFLGPPVIELSMIWFGVFMVLATTGFSVLTININMLGGFWSKDNSERVRISTWREAFGLLGLLMGALLPSILNSQFSERNSFAVSFLIFGILMFLAFVLFQGFLKKYSKGQSPAVGTHGISLALFSIIKGYDRRFFSVCFLSYLAASIPAVLVLFFIRDYLQAEIYSGLFLALYFLSGAVFITVWSRVSNKNGAYKAWLFSMILSVITFIGAAFLSPGDVLAYGFICALSGIALGADLALPPAIIAGRVERQGRNHEASQYYAVLAFLPKVAMAVAAGFSLIVLDIFGFEARQENSADALTILLMTYAAAPCLVKMMAAGLLWNLIKKEGHDNEDYERSVAYGTARNS